MLRGADSGGRITGRVRHDQPKLGSVEGMNATGSVHVIDGHLDGVLVEPTRVSIRAGERSEQRDINRLL